jgi:hypothetical protein
MPGAAKTSLGGRPSLLTPELADRLVAELRAGAGLADAARACGLDPRLVRAWRDRARSHDPRDAAFVALARRLEAARLVAARRAGHAPRTWQEAAVALASQYPDRWELPAPEAIEDVLAAYYDR